MRLLSVGAVLSGMLAIPARAWPQASISGTVRDSVTHSPVEGITVLLDGRPMSLTNSRGVYRVLVEGAGPHVLAFSQPRYLALIKAIEFALEVSADPLSVEHDVAWPNMKALARQLCPGSPGNRGVIAGNVEHGANGRAAEIQVTARWRSNAPGAAGANRAGGPVSTFGGVTVTASADGSFLACNLPSEGEIELFASLGLARGPVQSLRMHAGMITALTLRRP